MKYLVVFTFLMQFLFSLEVVLDTKESESSELRIMSGQQYFGEKLFRGKFKGNRQFKYNPKYVVNINDKLSVKMWGTHNYADDELTVDKKGNVFIPEVGAVHLLGLTADKVQSVIEQSVKKIFNKNVHVYADIKQYQSISLFVSGSVSKAGLYNGLSTDSILQFIDKAGGPIRGEGSYRSIEILRDNQVIQTVDLYDFLVTGNIELFQFQTSDVIVVKPVENFISVRGDVTRPYKFELLHEQSTVKDVMDYVLPKSTTNSFIITSWKDRKETTKEYPLEMASSIYLKKGDKLKFRSNYYVENIEISIEGEHIGTNYISIAKGTTLYDILEKVNFTPLSDIKNIHFYRRKIASMQQKLLNIKLKALETKVLTRDSSTAEEAKIYQSESAQVLSFIQRAKAVKQKGQVVLRLKNNLKRIVLEEGDRISIPKKNNIVVIQGEVAIPTALAYDREMKVSDYIDFCGGYTEDADNENVLLIKANGRVIKYHNGILMKNMNVNEGDSILVLQKVKTKNMLIFKDLTQILYQIAIGAAVILQF
jgi:protein involved in polysaccharide export with SLBB domain